MSKIAGREYFECPFCWLVLYSKSALTAHKNKEHEDETDLDQS